MAPSLGRAHGGGGGGGCGSGVGPWQPQPGAPPPPSRIPWLPDDSDTCALPLPPLLPLVQVEEGRAVAIYAEGKEHAMAVGYTKMSTAQVRWRGGQLAW